MLYWGLAIILIVIIAIIIIAIILVVIIATLLIVILAIILIVIIARNNLRLTCLIHRFMGELRWKETILKLLTNTCSSRVHKPKISHNPL